MCVRLVGVSALQAAWCTPTSRSLRSSPTKPVTTPSWTSRERWLYDGDTGFSDFFVFLSLTNKRLLFMEYFSREVLDSWNGGLGMRQSPSLSCVCHGFQTARGIVGFFMCVFMLHIWILILYMCTMRRRETRNRYYLYYVSWLLYNKNAWCWDDGMFPDNRSTQPEWSSVLSSSV